MPRAQRQTMVESL